MLTRDYTVYLSPHTHPFNDPLSGTTRVSQYQKGKTNLDFTEARDSERQWHQLGDMQVCTLLQIDNHASTPPLIFYRPDALPATQPTVSKYWRHHTCMKKWNDPYLPSLSIYIAQSITACQPVLISSPAQGRRLSWPGWIAFAVICYRLWVCRSPFWRLCRTRWKLRSWRVRRSCIRTKHNWTR